MPLAEGGRWWLGTYLLFDCWLCCGPDYFWHGMNAISQKQNFLSESYLLNPINEHWPRAYWSGSLLFCLSLIPSLCEPVPLPPYEFQNLLIIIPIGLWEGRKPSDKRFSEAGRANSNYREGCAAVTSGWDTPGGWRPEGGSRMRALRWCLKSPSRTVRALVLGLEPRGNYGN